jgi:hypothetical protein
MEKVLANKIKHGCGVFIDTSSSYINCGNSSSLHLSEGTIGSWVKLNGNTSGFKGILVKRLAYGVFVNEGYVQTWDWSTGSAIDTGVFIGDGKHHHIAFSFRSGISLGSLIMIDGVVVKEFTYTISSQTEVVTIGAGSTSVQFINADIDEVRIWNYARTPEQIKANYTKTLKPQTGLVAYYKLDGNALDSSGFNNHGTVNGGVTWSENVADELEKVKVVSSGLNGSAEFDGVDDYIDLPDDIVPVSVIREKGVTYEAWVKVHSLRSGEIVGQKPSSTYSSHASGGIRVKGGKPSMIAYSDSNPAAYIESTAPNKLSLNTWYHIAGVFDITDSTLKLYVNGVHQATSPTIGVFSRLAVNYENRIGMQNHVDYPFPFDGEIAGVRIWSITRTPEQIKNDMFTTFPAGTTDLAGQWTLNGNALGTNGNNGTPSGGVKFVPDAPRRLLTSRSRQPYALSFYEVQGEYVDVSHSDSMVGIRSFTYEAWMRFDTSSASLHYVATKRSGNTGMWISKWNISGAFQVGIYTSDGGFWIDSADIWGKGFDEIWRYLSITFNADTNEVKIYINGTLADTKVMAPTGTLAIDNTAPFIIGCAYDNRFPHKGGVFNPRFFNRVRTADEIKEDMYRVDINREGLLFNVDTLNNRVRDLSPHKQSVSLVGAPTIIPSTAPVGQRSGLRFNTNKYVNAGAILQGVFGGTRSFSVEGWVYLRDTNGRTILGKYNGGVAGQFILSITSGVVKSHREVSPFTIEHTNATVPLNTWTHVVFVYDGANRKVLINGADTGAYADTGSCSDSTTANDVEVCIGASQSSGAATGFFYGGLSSVRVLNKALTQAEIKANMHRYLPADTPNLVEQWKLNEGVGDIAYGTKGNDGSIIGAKWTTPSLMNWRGKVLTLNGTDQHVEGVGIDLEQWSMECWAYRLDKPSTDTSYWHIFTGEDQGHFAFKGSSSTIYFYKGGVGVLSVSGGLPVSTWTHLAWTYDGTAIKTYKDGALVREDATANGNITSPLSRIGKYSLEYFKGKIDELRLWNRARTQAEIQENMYRSIDRHPNLVLNMGFESGYYDSSGCSNHGTPVNDPVIEDCDNDKLLYNAPIND